MGKNGNLTSKKKKIVVAALLTNIWYDCDLGSTMDQWLLLLPHSKTVLGSVLGLVFLGGVCMLLCFCVGFLQLLCFSSHRLATSMGYDLFNNG